MSDHDKYPLTAIVNTEPLVNIQMTASQFAHLTAFVLMASPNIRVDGQSVGDYVSLWMDTCNELGYKPDDIWNVAEEIRQRRTAGV